MSKLVPVNYNPFEDTEETLKPQLVPVDYNPFEDEKAPKKELSTTLENIYIGKGANVTRQQLEQEPEDLGAFGQDVKRVSFRAAKNLTSAVLNGFVPDSIMDLDKLSPENRNKFLNQITEAGFKHAAPVLSAVDWTSPNVVDPKTGRVKHTETVGGIGLEIGAFIFGASKATKAAQWLMKGIQSAPKTTKAASIILGGEATVQVLSDPEENVFNVVQEALTDPKNPNSKYIGKGIVDYMAANESDTEATRRLKLLVEGLGFSAVIGAVGLMAKGTGKTATVLRQKTVGKRLDKMTEEEANTQLLKFFETERSKLKETDKSLKQVISQTSGDKTLSQKAASAVYRVKQQLFTSRGYATPLLFEALEKSQFAQRQLITAAENTANRLNIAFQEAGNDPKLLKKINTLLEADLSKVFKVSPEKRVAYFAKQRNIPENVASEILEARSMIDGLSEKILKTKGFSPKVKESIEANLNTYLRRSYRAYEDAGYTPDRIVKDRAKKYIVDNIIDDEILKLNKKGTPLTEARRVRIEEKAGLEADKQIKELLGDTSNLKDYLSQVKRVGKIHKKNTELAPEIRELLGEIKNPSDNIIISLSKASRILEMQNFYNSANTLGKGKYIFGSKTDAVLGGNRYTAKITGTNSSLDGKYTTPEMADFLARKEETYSWVEADNPLSNAYRYYIGSKGFAQSMKTTYSHTTHARNVVGGYQFGIANGRLWGNVRGKSYDVLKNKIYNKNGSIRQKELDKIYEEYLGLGVINTSVTVNQFRDMIDTGIKGGSAKFKGLKEAVVDMPITGAIVEGAEKTSTKASKTKLYDSIVNKPSEIYMATDDYFKIGAYEAELQTLREAFPNASKNLLKKQAAEVVRNTMPNYEKIPKGIKALRNLPIGNFVAFPAEILRTSAHIAKQSVKEIGSKNKVLQKRGAQRLAGLVTTQIGFGGIAKVSHDAMGFSDQDVEDRKILGSGPFSNGHDLIYTRDENGDIYTLNTQYLNSYYSLLSPIRASYDSIISGELKGEAFDKILTDALVVGLQDLSTPYVSESIATGPIRSLVTAWISDTGKDTEGRPIFTDKGVQWDSIIKSLKTSFAPGTAVSIGKLMDSIEGKPNDYTLKYRDSRYEAIAQSGFKWDKQDLEFSFGELVNDYKFADSQTFINRIKASSTTEDVIEDFLKTNSVEFQNQQDIYIAVSAAVRQLGGATVMEILRDKNISKEKAEALVAGQFMPTKIGNNLIDKKIKILNSLKTEKEYLEFKKTLTDTESKAVELYNSMQGLPLDNAGEYDFDRGVRMRRLDVQPKSNFATGGEVSTLVPNAPIEPDERINKLTGLPYNEGAGTAYMDEDDPMRRMNMAAGGRVKKSAGGKIAKLIAEPLSKIIKKYSKGEVSDEVAEEAANKILRNFEGSDDMPSLLDDPDMEDYIKLETKALLEEKHDLTTAQLQEQFPDVIKRAGGIGGEEFSKVRGYTADERETFEAASSYDDVLGDTSDIRAEIQYTLDDLKLTQKNMGGRVTKNSGGKVLNKLKRNCA